MDHLYAPWRTEYFAEDKSICPFCAISADHKSLLYHDEICFAVMNKYPYSVGHFMIIPHLHTDKLEDLPPDQWIHIAGLAQQGVKLIKDVLGATGVNLGMNLGKSAGAGIDGHIHLHLVPRFEKDTNFITTIGETRVYGTDFELVFNRLKEASNRYFVAKQS